MKILGRVMNLAPASLSEDTWFQLWGALRLKLQIDLTPWEKH